MLDGYDIVFKNGMERELNILLHGDNDNKGLYQQILSSQDWDTFSRTQGRITAYEDVLARMSARAKRMGQDEDDESLRFGGMAR